MKRPQPDIGDTLRASFINNVSTVKKLKRLWGTTTVGGVEVLNHRQYYFPHSSRSAEFEKLFKFLGAYNDVTASDPQGVESAWLYLNKNASIDLSSDYNDFVAHNLNQLWWDAADGTMPSGLTLTASIVIEAEQTSRTDGSVRTTNLLSPSSSKAQLIQDIETHYDTLWDTCHISHQGVGIINKGSITHPVSGISTPDEDDLSPDDPWLSVLIRNVLRSNGPTCTIQDVSIGLGFENGVPYNTYVVDIEIPYNSFQINSLFVDDIVTDLSATYTSKLWTRLSWPNGYWTQKAIRSMDSSDLADPDVITRPYRLWEDEDSATDALYQALWFNHEGTWYIRAEPFTNPSAYGLKYSQLNDYILQLVDSGFKKKKVPWWKKLVAIIVFVLAFMYAPQILGKTMSVASKIMFASLVLNVATAVFSALGMHEWAMAFAEVSKYIEPLVKVAQAVMLIDAISAGLDKLKSPDFDLSDLIQDKIESFLENLVDSVTQGFEDIMSGSVASDASLKLLNRVGQLVNLVNGLKLESLNERNKDLKAEYEELVAEMGRESDVLQSFANIYAKPATADWSMYAAIYDMPYERGGGTLALGNVQRTTKQALRKADYDDPAFDNILVI